MTTKPFVTVGIIARNEAGNISRTLSFLIEQTYDKSLFEILVIDGNSSDGTREEATAALEKSGISFKVVNERDYPNNTGGPNFGPCWGRNLILDLSDKRAEYIALTDADCRTDKNWLNNLVEFIVRFKDDKTTVGAGGPRYVEKKGDITPKELMLNYYFTSHIMSLGNPAFSSDVFDSEKLYQMGSIAGYNSIYKKEILLQYRYDNELIISDDNEINYRITRDGLKLVFCPTAFIYHREEAHVLPFLRNIRRYGMNIANTVRKHKKMVRIYVPIGILYFLYIITLPITIYLSDSLFGMWYLPLLPFILVFLLALAVFIENIRKTKSLVSLYIFAIVPLHPFLYAVGLIENLLGLKKFFRK